MHTPRGTLKNLLFLLCATLLILLICQAVIYRKHYPLLIGAYCHEQTSLLHIPSNDNIHNESIIQQCSLVNIDTCQQIADRSLLFRLHNTAGFTSEFNNLIRAFIFAIETRRRFLVDDQLWNYGSFSSFFNISQGHFSPWLPSSSYCLQRKFVHFIEYDGNQTSAPEHLAVSRGIGGGYEELNLKMKSLENHTRILQMKRTVAQYFWNTMNRQTRDFIIDEIKKVNLKNLTFGLHIRRGDKLLSEAQFIRLENYINGVEYFLSTSRPDGKIDSWRKRLSLLSFT